MGTVWDTLFLLVVLVVFIFGCSLASLGIPSEGTATDSIARVSEGGLIWKTWKVQLTNDHPIDGNPMQYGIEDNETLREELQHYAETGERVKISYEGKLFVWGWEYSDNEVIYEVEPIGEG